MLPVPDGDAVVGVGGDEPGVSGVEVDLHNFVGRSPRLPRAAAGLSRARGGRGLEQRSGVWRSGDEQRGSVMLCRARGWWQVGEI